MTTVRRFMLNIPAIEDAIFNHADAIWAKYSNGQRPDSPHDFAAGVIATFDQRVHETDGSPEVVLRAAARSLASNGRTWTNIRARLHSERLTSPLGRPVAKENHQRRDLVAGLIGDAPAPELSIDEWADHLKKAAVQEVIVAALGGGDMARKDTLGMASWAALLSAHPDYYETNIDYARRGFREADSALSAGESFLCVATYFSRSDPFAGRRTQIDQPRGQRKWPRMGLPLACEFLRNLGWNGFKPDRHIMRLLGLLWPDVAPQAEDRMHRIEQLVGIAPRAKHPYTPAPGKEPELRGQLICALTGIALTPDSNYTVADNLLWLLGSEVETSRVWKRDRVERLPDRYLLSFPG